MPTCGSPRSSSPRRVIAIRYRPAWAGRAGAAFAVAGLLFAGARLAGNTISFWMYDRAYDRELAAVDHIPRGARVVSFVGVKCRKDWAQTRLEHLPALALVRRDAFSNDQWSMSGAQLLTARYPDAQLVLARSLAAGARPPLPGRALADPRPVARSSSRATSSTMSG